MHFRVGAKGDNAPLVGLAMATIAFALAAAKVQAVHAEGVARPADEKNWQAVAPGRVEPVSGEIRIGAPLAGLIAEVPVKTGDKVAAGELLVRLKDPEMETRIASAQAQIAMRKRARNDQAPSSRAGDRRQAEDAVSDGHKAVVDAQSDFDRVAMERRAGNASDAELEAAGTALSRARDRLRQLRADLGKLEADSATPLPTPNEGQLNIARAELWTAEAASQKLSIRAPISGTVLQVNAKPGELAVPSATQPLLLLGDISALRVRAELDERDYGEIRIGQAVSVRPAAFRGREFAGKVYSIAPLVEAARNSRGQRNQTDVDVVEVLVDLAEPGPLAIGMKVDVYFQYDSAQH